MTHPPISFSPGSTSSSRRLANKIAGNISQQRSRNATTEIEIGLTVSTLPDIDDDDVDSDNELKQSALTVAVSDAPVRRRRAQ